MHVKMLASEIIIKTSILVYHPKPTFYLIVDLKL